MSVQFDNFTLSSELLRAITDMNYTETTEIQASAIPLVLEGRDVIGRSSTGTGKTAAFGVPAVEMVDGNLKYPQVLVLSPTRELAMQIAGEMRKYAKYKQGVSFAIVYGGQSMDLQIRQLRTANIVIGTPGRIMDHMRRHTLHLDRLRMAVLDEADEMLNMGFLEDIQTILAETPQERQTVLFSATMPAPILKITKEFQKDPVMVAVDKGQPTLESIKQYFYQVPQARKLDALNLLLQYHSPARSIVFCNTKAMVDEMVQYFSEHSFKSIGLHGDMKQMMRTRVMQDFKTGRIPILVATDVAARGIDVEDVDAVFNFDIPQETEYYIHRIGRTGRAGKTGVSYTLVCSRMQVRRIKEIEDLVKSPIIEQPVPSPEDIMVKRREKMAARAVKAMEDGIGVPFEPVIDSLIAEGHDIKGIACALAGILSGRDKKLVPAVRAAEPVRSIRGGAHVFLKLHIGRNNMAAPNVIVAAVLDATGLTPSAIGKIDIRASETYVEMTPDNAEKALRDMENGKIRGLLVKPEVVSSKPFAASADGPRDYRNLPRKSNRGAPTYGNRAHKNDHRGF